MTKVYADNAATTAIDPDALDVMVELLSDDYANPSQPYRSSKKVRDLLYESRVKIANCIGAEPNEIFFTSGGSESDNWAIKGTNNKDSKRNQIITSQIEHFAILKSCGYMESAGFEVIYLRPSREGTIDPKELSDTIGERTRLVSIMMANNEIGTIQPIKELCKIAHQKGALFHTDAVQAVGHIPINVKDLGIDLLSASAHKFNGPKGTGFLYIRKGTPIDPLIHGGHQEYNHRAGTENVASIIAMAIALENNTRSIGNNMRKVRKLEDRLIGQLEKEPFDYVINSVNDHLPGIVNISFKDVDGESLFHRLDLLGVDVSTGSACNGMSNEISHVIKAIGVDDAYSEGTIRISLGKNNSEEDVDYIVLSLRKILGDQN